MSTDAQIAREWARRVVESAENAQPVSRGALAAARHVLSTTTPPTMADIAWDDEVHAGLCADHPDNGRVRMIHAENALIWCYHGTRMGWLAKADLTPIPGTRVDLTPRRESVPESTSEHPATLTTREDYENAPEGTIVEEDFCHPWVKDDRGIWLGRTAGEGETCLVMPIYARRVLRWGWGA